MKLSFIWFLLYFTSLYLLYAFHAAKVQNAVQMKTRRRLLLTTRQSHVLPIPSASTNSRTTIRGRNDNRNYMQSNPYSLLSSGTSTLRNDNAGRNAEERITNDEEVNRNNEENDEYTFDFLFEYTMNGYGNENNANNEDTSEDGITTPFSARSSADTDSVSSTRRYQHNRRVSQGSSIDYTTSSSFSLSRLNSASSISDGNPAQNPNRFDLNQPYNMDWIYDNNLNSEEDQAHLNNLELLHHASDHFLLELNPLNHVHEHHRHNTKEMNYMFTENYKSWFTKQKSIALELCQEEFKGIHLLYGKEEKLQNYAYDLKQSNYYYTTSNLDLKISRNKITLDQCFDLTRKLSKHILDLLATTEEPTTATSSLSRSFRLGKNTNKYLSGECNINEKRKRQKVVSSTNKLSIKSKQLYRNAQRYYMLSNIIKVHELYASSKNAVYYAINLRNLYEQYVSLKQITGYRVKFNLSGLTQDEKENLMALCPIKMEDIENLMLEKSSTGKQSDLFNQWHLYLTKCQEVSSSPGVFKAVYDYLLDDIHGFYSKKGFYMYVLHLIKRDKEKICPVCWEHFIHSAGGEAKKSMKQSETDAETTESKKTKHDYSHSHKDKPLKIDEEHGQIVVLPCDHYFHWKCLTKGWLNKPCPLCRAKPEYVVLSDIVTK